MKQSLFAIGTWSVFVLTLFSACTPTSKTLSYEYDYLFINKQGIIQRPLIADLEVGKQKITLNKTYKNVLLSTAKQQIIEEFIRSNNADLIVQPFFSTQSESTTAKSTIQITLTGYPANYRNIRNYEPKDRENLLPVEYLLNHGIYPVRAVSAAEVLPLKKPSVAQLLLGAN